MNFEAPAWLQEWIGVHAGGGDETVLGRVEMLRPLSATFSLILALLAAATVFYCYSRATDASRRYRLTTAFLRLAVVGLLIAMIGELSITLRRAGLPTVVVLVDDSESMNIADRYADPDFAKLFATKVAKLQLRSAEGGASAAQEADAPSRIDALRVLLLENDAEFLRSIADYNYQIRVFAISDAARLLPLDDAALRKELDALRGAGKATRLGDGLRTALEELRGQPVAAVVLVSDGVNTAGQELPEVAVTAAQRNIQLFTVGVGETKKAIDIELAELKVRDNVMVNDLVSFDFTLTGRGSEGKTVDVTLREADGAPPLATKTVTISKDDVGQTVRLTHRPTKTGSFRYVVEAKPLPDESSKTDNRLEALVDVRTDKMQVLLVQSYPSFEYRYLKHMLGRDETVRLNCILQEADQDYPRTDSSVSTIFPVTLNELLRYDAVIFGDVDPEFLGASAIANLRDYVLERGRGVVFMAGPRFMPQAYRGGPLADLLPIDWTHFGSIDPDAATNEGTTVRLSIEALEEPIFQLGDTSEESRAVWQNLPPIYWVLDVGKRKAAQSMVETAGARTRDGASLPVILFQRAGRGMVLFHTTDETWRWRWRIGDLYFARYWVQALRQLATAKGAGRSAVLRVGKDEYDVGKPIGIEVRYQDERSAPADGRVSVVVESDGRPDQTVELIRRRNLRDLFEASVSGLPEGKYRVRLTTPLNAPLGDDVGSQPPPILSDNFVVRAARVESFPLEADHAYLTAAAAAGKGAFFRFNDAAELLNKLPRGKLSPTEPLPPVGLWNKWYTLLLLTSLLVLEWIMRKRRAMV